MLGEVEELLRSLRAAVAGLDRLGREMARERAFQALADKVKAPGRLVDAALSELAEEPTEAPGTRPAHSRIRSHGRTRWTVQHCSPTLRPPSCGFSFCRKGPLARWRCGRFIPTRTRRPSSHRSSP